MTPEEYFIESFLSWYDTKEAKKELEQVKEARLHNAVDEAITQDAELKDFLTDCTERD